MNARRTSASSQAAVPVCTGGVLSRRDFLKNSAIAAAALPLARLARSGGVPEPSAVRAPTAIGLCKRYDVAEVRTTLSGMLNPLGVRQLVRRKHVTVKVNLVNSSAASVAGVPLPLTVTVHPVVARALGSLLVDWGARQVVFADQLPFSPLGEEAFEGYGFNLPQFRQAMSGRVSFANTRNRGPHGDYATVKVPRGELATSWEVNRAYVDTDVLVSLAKLKSHVSAGVTGGLKNLFGVPPSSLYGNDAKDGPNEDAVDYRDQTMHACTRLPVTSVRGFTGKSVSGDHGHNVPRFIVDLAEAFPIQLTVIDGISAIQGAEGWWNGSMVSVTRPGLLLAGCNPVCTDAIAAAVMGFDPDAPDRTWPFANGANYLALARLRGLGENRVRNLEVTGVALEQARFEYHPTYRRRAV